MRGDAIPPKILCIDDEQIPLKLRCELLRRAGYKVISAASGREAILAFSGERVDLIVLDYWMAGLDGLEVAAYIKRQNPTLPIVMLSGYRPILNEDIGRVDRWLIKGQSEIDERTVHN